MNLLHGNSAHILPLLSVVESFRPKGTDVKRLANGLEVVKFREEIIPLLRLHSLLKRAEANTEVSEGLVVVVENHESKFAVLVDDLIGQQQIVIKNLESNFTKVPGVSGATILGDGSVALILDIDSLKSLPSSFDSGANVNLRPESNDTESDPALLSNGSTSA